MSRIVHSIDDGGYYLDLGNETLPDDDREVSDSIKESDCSQGVKVFRTRSDAKNALIKH